jgi:acetyltransferase-like isoleucine patch superfamily enzyme
VLTVDPTAKVSPLADIETSVRGTPMTIGAGVMIDAFVKIKPAGGNGALTIGRDSAINSGTVMYTGNGITIGEGVLIAANCTLAPTNHAFGDRNKRIRDQGFQPSRGGIVIEDDVWLGAGVVIGKGCVVAAGSVVRGKLEPYGIYGGAPLRRIATRGEA